MKRTLLLLVAAIATHPQTVFAATETFNVPDTGWNLWLDRDAKWESEPAFLPADVHLDKIQSRPPTGGWSTLGRVAPAHVTLPSTVEQHFWNADRYYKNEYFYEADDHEPRNGNYIGVSWWWKSIQIPSSFKAQHAVLHIRAAKQRAEVYVNQKLVGYNLVAETAFDCDVSKALKPGQANTIAIRITNPGGRLDWGDWGTATLGKVTFYAGHAFGGLDRGITLEHHDPDGLKDPWVMNNPEPRLVTFRSQVLLVHPGAGRVIAAIVDPTTGKTIAQGSESWSAKSNQGGALPITIAFFVPNAKLWAPQHPSLYTMRAWLDSSPTDVRNITFGFRSFGPSGIGKKAILKLNGERIRVYSAISWGFWGINGLWPTPSLAEKEVRVAKSLGLNSLNFHRNIARAEALDAADRIGLLRYTEPGGGMTLFWNKNKTDDPIQLYMIEKIVRMVRDHRSHPALTMYVVQNELDDDSFKHPIAEQILRRIHAEDPSRPAILKSGISPKGEMWMMPFDEKLYVDKGDGFSGWWDNHSVGYPDAWVDANYKNPTDYVYRSTNAKEIVDFGEMGGSGSADNHALMLDQIKGLGGSSYDRLDHIEVNVAYINFLNNFGFRQAFPMVKDLYAAIGAKQYNYWENVIQCARLSDENDYLTISGWETTAVENHGGLVDCLRNPHGDPAVLAAALRPVLPAIQLRRSAVGVGDAVGYDLFFLNETNRPVKGVLKVSLRSPQGALKSLGSFAVPKFTKDVFSYLVATNRTTPRLNEPGQYKLSYALGSTVQTKTIYVVPLAKSRPSSIGLIGHDAKLEGDLVAIGQHPASYHSTSQYSLVVATAEGAGALSTWDPPVSGTADPALYRTQRYGKQDDMLIRIGDLPNGPAKLTLGFAEQYFTSPNSRIFDLHVNGKRVLHDFDLFATAGGKDKVWKTTVDTEVSDGTIAIAPGIVKKDNACLNTIQIEAGGKTVSIYFGAKAYTATDGTIWQPYQPASGLAPELLDKVRQGLSLILISEGDGITRQFATQLASAGAFKFEGLVGKSRAPWMGSWYFVRQHPLYAGLPVNTVMKGEYQVGLSNANGIVVSGPNLEVVSAYSRDHSRTIGAGDVIAKLGKGRIIFHVVPRMTDAFQKRWLSNAIRYGRSR